MKIIVSKNKHTWTGVILNGNKLFYSTYGFSTKEELLSSLKQKCTTSPEIIEEEHPIICAMNNIVNGTDYTIPEIEFDFTGYTDNEIKVLKTLFTIPPGETVTYGELARLSGLENAARFVGNVMAKNRFGPLIPCHRVILSNGKLGNFSAKGGVKLKKKLLEQEKQFKQL